MRCIRVLPLALVFALGCGGSSTEPADPTVPASIVLSQSSDTTYPGWRIDLPSTTVYNSQHQVIVHNVVWTSADTAIAKIKGGATVQGYAEGIATVTATAGPASTDVRVHIVHEHVSAVLTDPNSATLFADDSIYMTAYAFGPALDSLHGRIITLAALDPAIATITPAGMIHIHSTGTGRIVATSEGIADTAAIFANVTRVARITVTPTTVQTTVGQWSPEWVIHVYDSLNNELFDRPVFFISSDTTVAHADYGGVLGVSPGTASITIGSDTAVTHVPVTVSATP